MVHGGTQPASLERSGMLDAQRSETVARGLQTETTDSPGREALLRGSITGTANKQGKIGGIQELTLHQQGEWN